jgi:hypothetical protein
MAVMMLIPDVRWMACKNLRAELCDLLRTHEEKLRDIRV